MNKEEICLATIEAVKKAGAYIMQHYDKKDEHHIEEKGKHNFVTIIDKNTEKLLVKELAKILPEAGFITEEGTEVRKGKKFNWIIDPIDGTTNFIHGAFPFAVSVALAEDKLPVIGVVLELGMNECFYAWKNGGAYLNGKSIEVSRNSTVHQSLFATGFPYSNYSKMKGFMASVDFLIKNSQGVRRLGSAATDMAWVACGRFDGFYQYGLSPWDVAGATVILEEAGGKCSDFSGGNDYIFGGEIICGNQANHKEFLDLMKVFLIEDE